MTMRFSNVVEGDDWIGEMEDVVLFVWSPAKTFVGHDLLYHRVHH